MVRVYLRVADVAGALAIFIPGSRATPINNSFPNCHAPRRRTNERERGSTNESYIIIIVQHNVI